MKPDMINIIISGKADTFHYIPIHFNIEDTINQ